LSVRNIDRCCKISSNWLCKRDVTQKMWGVFAVFVVGKEDKMCHCLLP